jgi:hypothetical protein
LWRRLGLLNLTRGTGPFNYIAMVEAFKNGPHATTPLRICMNSSLRQPAPVSKSLNDCLMKGPTVLVDLSMELETVAARGGIQFKETLTSEDTAAYPSEPRKVLGLIWETQQDKLLVVVKLNTEGKRGGARLKEDVDLEGDLDKAIPEAITKRILWRVWVCCVRLPSVSRS